MENKLEMLPNRNADQLRSRKHAEWLKLQVGDQKENESNIDQGEYRRRKILQISWNKFNQFRLHPNMKQIIKIDTISDRLKPYFLDPLDENDIITGKQRYAVSFEKIINIFENVQEIHFINDYKFDNSIMDKLIRVILKKENKLRSVKFLYYDYKDNRNKNTRSVPNESYRFFNPSKINDVELLKVGWELKYKKNGKAGYKINIVSTCE